MNPHDKLKNTRVWMGVYVSVRTQFYVSGRVVIKLLMKNFALYASQPF